jgi:hypothetical protein
MQVAELRRHGHRDRLASADVTNVKTLRELLEIGGRYIEQPDGSLDIDGSSPEAFDLARELKAYISVKDVTRWTDEAIAALERLQDDIYWTQLNSTEQHFIEDQLEPFLVRVLNARADEGEE